jgi:hypothetical protein
MIYPRYLLSEKKIQVAHCAAIRVEKQSTVPPTPRQPGAGPLQPRPGSVIPMPFSLTSATTSTTNGVNKSMACGYT